MVHCSIIDYTTWCHRRYVNSFSLSTLIINSLLNQQTGRLKIIAGTLIACSVSASERQYRRIKPMMPFWRLFDYRKAITRMWFVGIYPCARPILSFVNASDTGLANKPKMSVFAKFYRNHGIRWKILHSAQLHVELEWYVARPVIASFHHNQW